MTVETTLAFVFPGQGSQSVGMLSEMAAAFPEVQATFAEASAVLDFDAWALSQAGPAAELNQTAFTQPTLLAADIALWRVWKARGGAVPAVLAGHSLGEFAALVAAEAVAFQDAVTLVALRGRYMQAAVAEGAGAMAAIIGLDDATVTALCQTAADGAVLAPANYNAIGQVVVAGDAAAVNRVVVLAKEAGARMAKLIPVSVPSHCSLMASAAEQLAEAMGNVTIKTPKIPVIHNANVMTASTPDDIRVLLAEQLVKPVRWVDTLQALEKQGITRVIECGPGKVLSGLIKRTTPDMTVLRLETPALLDQAL